MDSCDWDWRWNIEEVEIIEKRRMKNELWKIWWSICITRIKR